MHTHLYRFSLASVERYLRLDAHVFVEWRGPVGEGSPLVCGIADRCLPSDVPRKKKVSLAFVLERGDTFVCVCSRLTGNAMNRSSSGPL